MSPGSMHMLILPGNADQIKGISRKVCWNSFGTGCILWWSALSALNKPWDSERGRSNRVTCRPLIERAKNDGGSIFFCSCTFQYAQIICQTEMEWKWFQRINEVESSFASRLWIIYSYISEWLKLRINPINLSDGKNKSICPDECLPGSNLVPLRAAFPRRSPADRLYAMSHGAYTDPRGLCLSLRWNDRELNGGVCLAAQHPVRSSPHIPPSLWWMHAAPSPPHMHSDIINTI